MHITKTRNCKFCSASGMFVEIRVPPIEEMIRNSKYSILCRKK